MFDLIAFDAYDTLWHSERLYVAMQKKVECLLAERHGLDGLEQALYRTEMRNMPLYGFGIKAFALSTIETAVRLTGGRIRGDEIGQIVAWAQEMLGAEVELLDHVEETVARLSRSHTLLVVTKGDLLDQERKLARSGIADHFSGIEVLPDKDEERYRALLARHGLDAQHFLMVGNSLRLDVLPAVARALCEPKRAGGQAAYIPAGVTWAHETIDAPGPQAGGYHQLAHIGLLPELIERIE
jgi:putative hydrolase of the HAD superfamily